jgi:hypothetical protein
MQPKEDPGLAQVSGTVKTSDRDPVAEQRLQLSSAKLRASYQTVTHADGTYTERSISSSRSGPRARCAEPWSIPSAVPCRISAWCCRPGSVRITTSRL